MKIFESGGIVPSARGFMSHSMMPAMIQRVPSANSLSVTAVPVGEYSTYSPTSLRNAQVLSQPATGSRGFLSPGAGGRPQMIERPGPEFAGRAYMNLPGLAFTHALNSSAVRGGGLTLAGL